MQRPGHGSVTPAVFCGTVSATVPVLVPEEVPDTLAHSTALGRWTGLSAR
jgi:hypothetical protein